MIANPTKVDVIAEQLALAIVAGNYPAGSRLPTMQQLATDYKTTIPTMQRVIAQLEAMSLVAGRKGSGVTVLDIESSGGPDLFALLIKNAKTNPDKAIKTLSDLLEMRRWIAVGLLRKFSQEIPEGLITSLQSGLDDFSTASAAHSDLSTMIRLEHVLLRTLMQKAQQTAALAIVNILEDVIVQSAELKQAIYADTSRTVHIWQAIIAALSNKDALANLRNDLESILETFDQKLISNFELIVDTRRQKVN